MWKVCKGSDGAVVEGALRKALGGLLNAAVGYVGLIEGNRCREQVYIQRGRRQLSLAVECVNVTIWPRLPTHTFRTRKCIKSCAKAG